MRKNAFIHFKALTISALLLAITFPAILSAGPLRVFIMAGQSNMEGRGEIDLRTGHQDQGNLTKLVQDEPLTFGHLKDGNGDWVVRDDVWIFYNREIVLKKTFMDIQGWLTTGYGKFDYTIGPELQFGNAMGDLCHDPILIIKIAWGGRSLAIDFRPPSSGWTVPPTVDGDSGYWYTRMIDIIDEFKADPSVFYPRYDEQEGYEFTGFAWHQGFNDRIMGAYVAEYEFNMKNFIKDIRDELEVYNLPFAIATTGMPGTGDAITLMDAQVAMQDYVTYPDHKGSVAVDETLPYWIDASLSPYDEGHHWNLNAKTYFNIGQGLADKMALVMPPADAPIVDAGADIVTWSGKPTQLTPIITDRIPTTWTNLTYEWIADDNTGVTFTDTNKYSRNPKITITKPTQNPSIVTVALAVNQSGRDGYPVENRLKIYVYDDECKAARFGKNLAAENPGDVANANQGATQEYDCITDEHDMLKFAQNWLKGTKLDTSKPSTPLPNPEGILTSEAFGGGGANISIIGRILESGSLADGRKWDRQNEVGEPPKTDTYVKSSDQDPPVAPYLYLQGNANCRTSLGGIVRPASLTYSIDMRLGLDENRAHDGRGAAFGFYDGSASGSNGTSGFTGLVVDDAGSINLVKNPLGGDNSYVGTKVLYSGGTWDITRYHVLTFTVNTYTDTITNITFEGSNADYSSLYDEILFDDASTAYVGIGNNAGGRVYVDNFSLTYGPGSNDLPTVDAGPTLITWSGKATSFNHDVDNNDTTIPKRSISYAWTASPSANVEFTPNDGGDGSTSSDPNPTVKFTKPADTNDATKITIALAVSLPGDQPVIDYTTIDVYDNACQAAKAHDITLLDSTDINLDCTTNLIDFAEMAATWMIDYSLLAPTTK